MFFTQPSFILFPRFPLCKKYVTLLVKVQQKFETFVVSDFMLFTQPSFMLFRVFRGVKSMKLYTQKVQQKHETFVVSCLVLFTQPSFKLFQCFSLCKKYETINAKDKTKAWNFCRVWFRNFYTTKRLILVSCFWGMLSRWL
jgi:hypothetical protein